MKTKTSRHSLRNKRLIRESSLVSNKDQNRFDNTSSNLWNEFCGRNNNVEMRSSGRFSLCDSLFCNHVSIGLSCSVSVLPPIHVVDGVIYSLLIICVKYENVLRKNWCFQSTQPYYLKVVVHCNMLSKSAAASSGKEERYAAINLRPLWSIARCFSWKLQHVRWSLEVWDSGNLVKNTTVLTLHHQWWAKEALTFHWAGVISHTHVNEAEKS